MQLNLKTLSIGLTAMIALASCGKSNKQGRYIPSNAAIVIQVDGKSLSTKLPWEEVKQNALLKEVSQDSNTSATLKKILDNPEAAGIDTKTDLIFFAVKDSLGGYVAFEGTIKDAAAFKAFNQEITNGGSEREKDGVSFISKAPICVGWNKEKFTYLVDAPEMGSLNYSGANETIRKPRDIGAACGELFQLSEGSSLGKEDRFTSLLKETGDLHLWINSEELNKGASDNPMLAMVNLDKLYKGSVTTATFNFDNGKISIKGKSYTSKEMTKLYESYSGGKISEEMLKKIPGNDVSGAMALNFKPAALKELLKLTGLDGVANVGLQKTVGFSVDDFVNANKGDITIGLSDFSVTKDSLGITKPDFKVVFAASIGDKDAFAKLISAGKRFGARDFDNPATAPFAYASNANYFVLANNQATADAYLSTTNGKFDQYSKINEGPFGGYLNIQTILKAMQPIASASKDSIDLATYDLSLKLWDHITWKGGEFKDGGIEQEIEIHLLDKNTNSLKLLNTYANKISELIKIKKERYKTESLSTMDYDTVEPAEASN